MSLLEWTDFSRERGPFEAVFSETCTQMEAGDPAGHAEARFLGCGRGCVARFFLDPNPHGHPHRRLGLERQGAFLALLPHGRRRFRHRRVGSLRHRPCRRRVVPAETGKSRSIRSTAGPLRTPGISCGHDSLHASAPHALEDVRLRRRRLRDARPAVHARGVCRQDSSAGWLCRCWC